MWRVFSRNVGGEIGKVRKLKEAKRKTKDGKQVTRAWGKRVVMQRMDERKSAAKQKVTKMTRRNEVDQWRRVTGATMVAARNRRVSQWKTRVMGVAAKVGRVATRAARWTRALSRVMKGARGRAHLRKKKLTTRSGAGKLTMTGTLYLQRCVQNTLGELQSSANLYPLDFLSLVLKFQPFLCKHALKRRRRTNQRAARRERFSSRSDEELASENSDVDMRAPRCSAAGSSKNWDLPKVCCPFFFLPSDTKCVARGQVFFVIGSLRNCSDQV